MMNLKTVIVFLILPFLFGGCTPKASTQLNANQDKNARFQMVLDRIYAEYPDAIGLMAHVEAPELGISWSGAVGSSKKGKKRINPLQPAWIASNTKTYVSATILRLLEQGKLELYHTLDRYLTDKTKSILKADGYNLNEIAIANLLSHTSGIFDYVNADAFFATLDSDPTHHWTRDEQIALSVSGGDPIGKAGEKFSYGDTNYLLLTEIIEQITGQAFYSAMRSLLNYEKHGLNSTWFIRLEDQPENTLKLVHQYSADKKTNTYKLDPSFDLYGGGGIAANTKDLANFSQLLFNKAFFDDPKTLDLIFTKVQTQDPVPSGYLFGLSQSEILGMTAYGHGGFWGTAVQYFPELNASVAVFVLERGQRILRKNMIDGLAAELQSRAR